MYFPQLGDEVVLLRTGASKLLSLYLDRMSPDRHSVDTAELQNVIHALAKRPPAEAFTVVALAYRTHSPLQAAAAEPAAAAARGTRLASGAPLQSAKVAQATPVACAKLELIPIDADNLRQLNDASSKCETSHRTPDAAVKVEPANKSEVPPQGLGTCTSGSGRTAEAPIAIQAADEGESGKGDACVAPNLSSDGHVDAAGVKLEPCPAAAEANALPEPTVDQGSIEGIDASPASNECFLRPTCVWLLLKPLQTSLSASANGADDGSAGGEIAVPIHIDASVPDYIVEKKAYEASLKRTWAVGDRFRMSFASGRSAGGGKVSYGSTCRNSSVVNAGKVSMRQFPFLNFYIDHHNHYYHFVVSLLSLLSLCAFSLSYLHITHICTSVIHLSHVSVYFVLSIQVIHAASWPVLTAPRCFPCSPVALGTAAPSPAPHRRVPPRPTPGTALLYPGT